MCNAGVSDLHAEAVEQNVDLAPVVTRAPTLLLFKVDLDYVDGIEYNVASKEPRTWFLRGRSRGCGLSFYYG